jgi:hypothetical protein
MSSDGFAESRQSLGKTYDGKKSCRNQDAQVCEEQLNHTLMPLA